MKLTVKRPASPSAGKSSVKKKRTPQELARDIVEGERAARLQMSAHSAKEKTKRELIKREAAHNTALEIEQLRLKHQVEEGARQRAHDLMMIDRQIQLEELRARVGSTTIPIPAPVFDPQLFK